jgi:hypothetical protein
MKKTLPLEFLQTFKPELGQAFKYETGPNFIVRILERENGSPFSFKISAHDGEAGKYHITYNPISQQDMSYLSSVMDIVSAIKHFNKWKSLVEAYNNTPSMFDDPITKKFEKDFHEQFNFVDDPSTDNEPYEYEIVLRLEEHLKKIEDGIEQYRTPETEHDVKQIKQLAVTLQDQITKESKGYLKKQIAKLWAKVGKLGTKPFKELILEGGKILLKEAYKQVIIEAGKQLLQ